MLKFKSFEERDQYIKEHRWTENRAIIAAMTDEELVKISDMIKEEQQFRATDFLSIPHYKGASC